MIYKFNDIELDTTNFRLSDSGENISVEPQVFNLIVYLIEHKDRLVTREEILDKVWHGKIVSDTSISNHIKSARKVLGDDGHKQQVIKTFHSRGYQFIPDTKIVKHSNESKLSPAIKNSIYIFVIAMVVAVTLFKIFTSTYHTSNEAGGSHQFIAVLPFSNTKPDKDSDYLGFALANQIIGDLSYLQNYTIRPSSSVRKYSNQVFDPIALGKELTVDYVLAGNYLKENDIIRLNVELIDIISNEILWQENIEVNYSNTFELQDVVASKVAKGLNDKFSPIGINNRQTDIPNNSLAYEYYLRSLSYPLTTKGDQLAIAMLNNSIELEQDYAPSHVEIGRRLNRLAIYGLGKEDDFLQAKEHLLTALSLNHESLAALRNLATFYVETGEILKAIEMTRNMLKINPNHADAYFSIAYIYRYAGLLDESIIMVEKALTLDPKNTKYRTLGVNYYNLGRYDKAMQTFELIKDTAYGLMWRGFIYYRLGENQKALANLTRLKQMKAGDFYKYIAIANIAIISDKKEMGLNALSKLEQSNVNDAEALYYWSSFYAALNDQTGSIRLLRKAVKHGYFNLPFMLKDPFFDDMRSNEEYQNILKTAKQKHLAFKKALNASN
jgi:DNA-binding winged helix-turn-helix (wHTH) protein/TolB-like protein/Tfp pilus assembly protein PilF